MAMWSRGGAVRSNELEIYTDEPGAVSRGPWANTHVRCVQLLPDRRPLSRSGPREVQTHAGVRACGRAGVQACGYAGVRTRGPGGGRANAAKSANCFDRWTDGGDKRHFARFTSGGLWGGWTGGKGLRADGWADGQDGRAGRAGGRDGTGAQTVR